MNEREKNISNNNEKQKQNMSNVTDNVSNISDDNDDVFEDVAITQKRLRENLAKENEKHNDHMPMTRTTKMIRGIGYCGDGAVAKAINTNHSNNNNNNKSNITPVTATTITTIRNQTSSGYSSYRLQRETLHLNTLKDDYDYDYDDGWRSYHYDEVGMVSTPPPTQQIHRQPFDDTINHKTILLGDSGVGKTSFLVKYNTGEFRLGSFSATVGIALTVILLGDSGVGKTSLLIMCRDGIYMPCYYVTTVGIDFMNKVVIIDGTRVKLQIWDTAGQERFRSVTHAYYRDAHALLLMYDVTNKVTYDNIRAWLCEIRDCAQEDVVIVLIGNKADCSNNDRQVKRDDGERLAREHNVPFMETSAKSGQNVELAFQTVARQLKNRGYEQSDDGKFNIHEFVRDNTKAKTMCAQCNL